MIQSLEEKMRFNKKRGTNFSAGYITGVKTYQKYPLKDKKGQQATKKAIDEFSKMARNGDEFAKGIMCGIRDASRERKERRNKT